MTIREAVIQAHIELGCSPETAELKAKMADAAMPEAAAFAAHSPVQPGQERQLIEELKRMFRKMDAHPKAVDQLRTEMEKRANWN